VKIAGALLGLAIGMMGVPYLAQAEEGIGNDTIKVGVIGPFSGPAAEYSKAQIGAISYLKSINDAGGIHGRKFEIVVEDDGCDEAKGIAAARKLIFDAKVFALASAYACSGPALAAKPIIVEAGVPWMMGGAASTELTTPVAPNVFQATATTVDVGAAMVRFAASKPNMQKIAVISHSNEWAKGYYDGAMGEAKKLFGGVILDVTMERQSTNATPQILRLREAAPDVVLAILYPAEMSIFLRDAHKLGLKTAIVTGYGTTVEDQLRRTGDPDAVKDFYAAYLLAHAADSPKMDKWREIVETYYPNETVSSLNFTSLGGAIIFVDALQKVGRDLTRAKLLGAIERLKDFDTEVMAGRFSYSPSDHAGQKDVSFVGLSEGKPVVFTAWAKSVE
jgi:branched-chain amino acid transport system substrate-binding protein